MIETLFFVSVIIFAVCFITGIIASMIYEDKVEALFKWYGALISTMTWSVFAIIPLGILTLFLKLFR
jgi:hypothetical protein